MIQDFESCDHKDFKCQLNTCHVLPLWQISAKTSPLKFILLDGLFWNCNFRNYIGRLDLSRFLHSVSSLFRTHLEKYSKVQTADNNMKSLCAHSGMKGQVGGFQNPGVCLPSPSPPRFLFLAVAPFFVRAKHRNSRFSDFLCSLTPWKRLLCRLNVESKLS